MPYLQGGTESAHQRSVLKPVPLGKLQRRFYEPLVLLLALTEACMRKSDARVHQSLTEAPSHTPDELFKDYVNKLCQICDNQRGGDTVTAISVIEYPDRIQYRFASNQRSEDDLLRVKSFLEGILETLKGYTSHSSAPLRASILRKIVTFNRPRLQLYTRHLCNQIPECLEAPKVSNELSDKLRELLVLARKADNRELEECEFLEACINLMLFIKIISTSPTNKRLQEMASSKSGGHSPWAELRHAAGRLLSYLQASKTLIEARKKWVRLFYDWEVKFVRSSTAHPNPVFSRTVNASEMLGRMGSEAEMQQYKAHAEELQKFDLDKRIQEQAGSSSFKPRVHAEILIHQSLIDEYGLTGLRPSHFFDGHKYIGSSKPTCRLCDYYFTVSATGIEVRKTHGNLYINWRAPDIYEHQGEAAKQRRKQIIIKVNHKVREDALRTLAEKIPERKNHDSNTDPTFPALNQGTSVGLDGGWRNETDVVDVAASMRQLGLHDPPGGAPEVKPGPSFSAPAGFDGDDDDGGARL